MSQTKRPRKSRDFSTVNPAAAAIDIGATIHVAAVGPNRDKELVRTFRTFTDDLCRLADWFAECGVRTVVMESTGVYWIPVFEILEQRGFEVMVVNARDAKHVPGRKTDVSDAQWLQRLHEYGLLRASFRPQAEIAGLRAYLRQRERLLDYAAAHIQHMQKAMMQMNLQLHHVVTDVTGVTGMAIIRAIVAGERDPNVLAAHRDRRCHASVETVCQALVGNYREEHVFALTQALELYDVYQTKVNACDKQIEAILKRLKKNAAQPAGKLLPIRQRTRQPNAPAFDARAALHAILGVDLTQISGLGPSLALKLVGECGTNLAAWPSLAQSTSRPGWRLRRTTKFPAGRCCRRRRGAPATAPRPCCGSPRVRLAEPTPPWVRSTAVCPRASGKPRQSPPLHAKSPSCSTTRFGTGCPMPIPGRHTTKNAIGSGSYTICNDGQSRSVRPGRCAT
jgi:transposase